MKIYFLILTFIYSLNSMALENIRVYAPDSPPFATQIDKGEGLLFDFVNELNQHFKGKYYFSANFVTRSRLKIIFAKEDRTMIVPFVNPMWFEEFKEKQYLWTTPAAVDCNVIILRRDRKFNITKWDDLTGLTTSIVNGQFNIKVQNLIAQKKIKVETASQLLFNFHKLDKKRVDFLVTGFSIADYVIKNMKFTNLEILHTPLDIFSRQILIFSKKNPAQGVLFREAISQMIKNKKLEKIQKKYNLNPNPDICHNRQLSYN